MISVSRTPVREATAKFSKPLPPWPFWPMCFVPDAKTRSFGRAIDELAFILLLCQTYEKVWNPAQARLDKNTSSRFWRTWQRSRDRSDAARHRGNRVRQIRKRARDANCAPLLCLPDA